MGTKKDTLTLMPLPKINELLFTQRNKSFTALDLCSGYYHTKLDKESILKSAFITVCGKSELLRLAFGLSQGPDFFMWPIYDLFRLDKTSNQGQGSGYPAYLDDNLIYSKTKEEHIHMIE